MEFKTWNPFGRSYKSGLVFILVVSAILYLVEWRNHGINMLDFEVYYRSAQRLIHGENLYRLENIVFYFFKYSPTSAMFFIPFTIVPFEVAKNIYWIFLALVTVLSFHLSLYLVSPALQRNAPSRFNTVILVLILALGVHLYREFVIGQINMVLFLSFLLVLYFYQSGKMVPSALVWSVGIFFKPWGLIFLPYFILKKNYRLLAYFALFTIGLLFLPVIFYGFNGLIEQTLGWFHEISVEMGQKQAVGAMFNHTIFSVLYRYSPLRFIELSGSMEMVYQLLVLITLGVLIYFFIRKGEGIENRQVTEWSLLMALMPLLAPANYNTFLLAALAMVVLMVHFRSLPLWGKALFILGMVVQGGNYNDVWGTDLSNYLLGLSLVSMGAISFIVLLFLLRYRKIA